MVGVRGDAMVDRRMRARGSKGHANPRHSVQRQCLASQEQYSLPVPPVSLEDHVGVGTGFRSAGTVSTICTLVAVPLNDTTTVNVNISPTRVVGCDALAMVSGFCGVVQCSTTGSRWG